MLISLPHLLYKLENLYLERLMSPLKVEIVYSQNAMTHYNGYLVDLMTHTYRIQKGL